MRLTRTRARERSSLAAIVGLVGAAACASPPPVSPVVQTPSTPVESEPPSEVPAAPQEIASAQPVATPTPTPAPTPHRELEAPEMETATYLAKESGSYQDVERLVRAKKWADAKRALVALGPVEEGLHRLDLHIASMALEARLATLLTDTKSARGKYHEVLDAWKDPNASVLQIQKESVGLADDAVAHHTGAALTAVGEARYASAEEERAQAVRIKFPVFNGNRSKEAVVAFIQHEVAPWISKKRAAIQKTETAYQKVVEIEPFAPPRWVMDSAERVGSLYESFVTDFESTPIPKVWADNPDLLDVYRSAMDGATEPLTAQARAAFEVCVRMSDKMAMEDDHSRICRAWLDKHPSAKSP